jgi:hypothetical protein
MFNLRSLDLSLLTVFEAIHEVGASAGTIRAGQDQPGGPAQTATPASSSGAN